MSTKSGIHTNGYDERAFPTYRPSSNPSNRSSMPSPPTPMSPRFAELIRAGGLRKPDGCDEAREILMDDFNHGLLGPKDLEALGKRLNDFETKQKLKAPLKLRFDQPLPGQLDLFSPKPKADKGSEQKSQAPVAIAVDSTKDDKKEDGEPPF